MVRGSCEWYPLAHGPSSHLASSEPCVCCSCCRCRRWAPASARALVRSKDPGWPGPPSKCRVLTSNHPQRSPTGLACPPREKGSGPKARACRVQQHRGFFLSGDGCLSAVPRVSCPPQPGPGPLLQTLPPRPGSPTATFTLSRHHHYIKHSVFPKGPCDARILVHKAKE